MIFVSSRGPPTAVISQHFGGKAKVQAPNENSSLSYGASPPVWDHSFYLPPDTSEHACPALTPASKLVLDLPTSEGWKVELSLGYPAMHRPAVELAIFRSRVWRPNH